MIIVTSNDMPGYKIEKVIGMDTGSSVKARNIFKDTGAGFKNITGGNLGTYRKLQSLCHEEAKQDLIDKATAQGANAIIAYRNQTNQIGTSGIGVFVYGTLVKIKED